MSGSTSGADHEDSYVLHAWPYQETSQILEALGAQHGRVGLVARGARRPTSRWRSVLQPFLPVRLSWVGRGSLYTLRSAEPASFAPALSGLALMGGFYLNELILNFVRRGDPHPGLFIAYSQALADLRAGGDPEPALRRFEFQLLAEVGYGLNLDHDVLNDVPLDPAGVYEYRLEQGPVPAAAGGEGLTFTGTELRAIGRGDFSSPVILRLAKRLFRAVLAHYLDGRTLKTREVMAAMRR